MAAEDLIPLGRLARPHGVRGEIRMLPYNPETEALQPGGTVTLQHAGERRQLRLTGVRPHKNVLLLTFEGCTDIDLAKELAGWEVCVHRDQLAPPEPGEVYHYELVGMRVHTTDGRDLGTVAEVMALPSNDVLVVRDAGCEYLIPMIGDVVREIDSDSRRVLIEPIPGLLED